MKPPPRIVDDAALPVELRVAVRSAVAAPEPYDVGRGEARLAAALALGATAATDGASAAGPAEAAVESGAVGASGLLGSGGVKLAISMAGVVLVAAGALFQGRSAPVSEPPPRAAPAASPAVMPPPKALPPSAEPSPTEAVETPTPSAEPKSARGLVTDDAARREIAQLGRIKELLVHTPAKALALAEAGHREFAGGLLREEREALAVIALWELGRGEHARHRAETFLAQYPNSSVRGQIERRLAMERHDAPPR
jgi:hypothetical protein